MKLKNVSLQTKILTLIIFLILIIILLLSGVYIWFEKKQTEEEKGELAFQVTKTVSYMPSVKQAIHKTDPESFLQPIAADVRHQVDAEYVIIADADGKLYAHPDESRLGETISGDDNYKALIFGQYFISQSESSLGPALYGKAPILGEDGNIIGIVSVGFLLEDIHAAIYAKVWDIGKISLVVLILGTIGGMLLAKHIRKETFGLEPYEIANLYRERNAILQSIKEGVIAVNQHGQITMMNQSATDMLGLQQNHLHEPIEKILPNTLMYRVLRTGENEQNQEMYLNNRWVIVNREVIKDEGKVVGAVASFRDRTEIKKMISTISEVRQYSEDLRAQTHEFSNKLYVLSGLLQLEHYSEAVDLIQHELTINDMQNHILFEQIQDRKVQAILLGKLGQASEKKINFSIDQNSSLECVPSHIGTPNLIGILGNIIDNAFDAVEDNEEKHVVFFTTDIGLDIIFEVVDNGHGIEDENKIFETGYSLKMGEDRGYGLTILQETVQMLEGSLEVKNNETRGTTATVFIPKNISDQGRVT